MKQRVGSAIEELEGDVSGRIYQKSVVTHPERIPGVVAAGIPRIDGGHGAGIRRDQRREREDTVAVLAAACRQSRGHSVAQPRKKAFAFTAVVHRIFVEGLREPVTLRRSYRRDAKVGPESLAVTRGTLLPLRRGVIRLAKTGREPGARDGVRSESVEDVVVEFRRLRR